MARAPSPTRETRVLPRIRVVLNDWNDPPPLRYGAASSRRRCGGRCLGLVGSGRASDRNDRGISLRATRPWQPKFWETPTSEAASRRRCRFRRAGIASSVASIATDVASEETTGKRNRPRSRRLHYRTNPPWSHNRILQRSDRRPRKTKRRPPYRSSFHWPRTIAANPSCPRRMSTWPTAR